jgi:hypothetical protein
MSNAWQLHCFTANITHCLDEERHVHLVILLLVSSATGYTTSSTTYQHIPKAYGAH